MVTSKHEQNIYTYRCAATPVWMTSYFPVKQQWFTQLLRYIYTTFLLFHLTALPSYHDTAFTSTPAAYLAVSKAGIMPFNYMFYIWEIRSEPRHYNPYSRNWSNLYRPCADFSISTIWILLRVWKERAVYLQDLVFERQNSELY